MAERRTVKKKGKRAQRPIDRREAPALRPARPVQRAAGREGSKTVERTAYTDYSLIFVILFLIVIGLVMLYSVSSYEAGLSYGDSFYYLKRQLIFDVLGIGAMLFISRIPVVLYRELYKIIYGVSVALVLAIIPFGTEVNGAKRWIKLVGSVNIQPAEVSKIAVIITTAVLIHHLGSRSLDTLKGMGLTLAPAVVQAGMIYIITNNLSSAVIILGIAVCMVFVASRNYRYFIALFGAGAAAVGGVVYMALSGKMSGFRSNRLMAWLNPEAFADSTAFQTLQALYAIGSGGFFGKGLGQSIQKLGFIPEAQNDMIFSIICEELGMFGAVGIMVMFMLLIARLVNVAQGCTDLYEAMIVVGATAHIAIQVILNIAVVTNTIPNTGVSLPFISYGGSSVVFLLAELGLVLSIARYHASEAA